jgi:hypothetical protein
MKPSGINACGRRVNLAWKAEVSRDSTDLLVKDSKFKLGKRLATFPRLIAENSCQISVSRTFSHKFRRQFESGTVSGSFKTSSDRKRLDVNIGSN